MAEIRAIYLAVSLVITLTPVLCQIPYEPCSPVNYLAAYPGVCGRFLACATFGYVPMDCPANLAFNEPRQVCDYRSFVPGCAQDTSSRCQPNPCGQFGTCVETPLNPRGFLCNCQAGYDGDYCTLDINECLRNNPCVRGTCRNSIGSYSCDCGNTRYTGRNCEIPPGGPCVNNSPCQYGTCLYSAFGNSCNCTAGYTGLLCETDIDECALLPCRNGGQCTDLLNGFNCDCSETGFIGLTCAEPETCVGGLPCAFGTCMGSPLGLICACQPGYTGPVCDSKIASCDPNPCFNGGACTPTKDGFECDCTATGFTGATCTQSITTSGPPCSKNADCLNGVCVATLSGRSCSCIPGYTGRNCELDINDCNPNPCFNGGICSDGVNSYTCNCAGTGYTGDTCTIPTVIPNPCTNNPCTNGRCIVQPNGSAFCNCTGTAFTGINCETPIILTNSNCPPMVCPGNVPRYNYPAWNDTSCSSYYNCEYGVLSLEVCPFNQRFDVISMSCQRNGGAPRFFCDSFLQ